MNSKSTESLQILIEELAAAMELTPTQVNDVDFNTNAIPGGFEPNVVGALVGVEKGQLSTPIIGNNGVYVVSVDDEKPAAAEKLQQLETTTGHQLMRANFEAYNAIKELADIEDNRAKFY